MQGDVNELPLLDPILVECSALPCLTQILDERVNHDITDEFDFGLVYPLVLQILIRVFRRS